MPDATLAGAGAKELPLPDVHTAPWGFLAATPAHVLRAALLEKLKNGEQAVALFTRQKAVQAAFEDALGRVRADIKSAATVTPRSSFASGVVASSAECRALVHLVSADLWLPAVVQRQPGGGATCVYADKSTETDVDEQRIQPCVETSMEGLTSRIGFLLMENAMRVDDELANEVFSAAEDALRSLGPLSAGSSTPDASALKGWATFLRRVAGSDGFSGAARHRAASCLASLSLATVTLADCLALAHDLLAGAPAFRAGPLPEVAQALVEEAFRRCSLVLYEALSPALSSAAFAFMALPHREEQRAVGGAVDTHLIALQRLTSLLGEGEQPSREVWRGLLVATAVAVGVPASALQPASPGGGDLRGNNLSAPSEVVIAPPNAFSQQMSDDGSICLFPNRDFPFGVAILGRGARNGCHYFEVSMTRDPSETGDTFETFTVGWARRVRALESPRDVFDSASSAGVRSVDLRWYDGRNARDGMSPLSGRRASTFGSTNSYAYRPGETIGIAVNLDTGQAAFHYCNQWAPDDTGERHSGLHALQSPPEDVFPTIANFSGPGFGQSRLRPLVVWLDAPLPPNAPSWIRVIPDGTVRVDSNTRLGSKDAGLVLTSLGAVFAAADGTDLVNDGFVGVNSRAMAATLRGLVTVIATAPAAASALLRSVLRIGSTQAPPCDAPHYGAAKTCICFEAALRAAVLESAGESPCMAIRFVYGESPSLQCAAPPTDVLLALANVAFEDFSAALQSASEMSLLGERITVDIEPLDAAALDGDSAYAVQHRLLPLLAVAADQPQAVWNVYLAYRAAGEDVAATADAWLNDASEAERLTRLTRFASENGIALHPPNAASPAAATPVCRRQTLDGNAGVTDQPKARALRLLACLQMGVYASFEAPPPREAARSVELEMPGTGAVHDFDRACQAAVAITTTATALTVRCGAAFAGAPSMLRGASARQLWEYASPGDALMTCATAFLTTRAVGADWQARLGPVLTATPPALAAAAQLEGRDSPLTDADGILQLAWAAITELSMQAAMDDAVKGATRVRSTQPPRRLRPQLASALAEWLTDGEPNHNNDSTSTLQHAAGEVVEAVPEDGRHLPSANVREQLAQLTPAASVPGDTGALHLDHVASSYSASTLLSEDVPAVFAATLPAPLESSAAVAAETACARAILAALLHHAAADGRAQRDGRSALHALGTLAADEAARLVEAHVHVEEGASAARARAAALVADVRDRARLLLSLPPSAGSSSEPFFAKVSTLGGLRPSHSVGEPPRVQHSPRPDPFLTRTPSRPSLARSSSLGEGGFRSDGAKRRDERVLRFFRSASSNAAEPMAAAEQPHASLQQTGAMAAGALAAAVVEATTLARAAGMMAPIVVLTAQLRLGTPLETPLLQHARGPDAAALAAALQGLHAASLDSVPGHHWASATQHPCWVLPLLLSPHCAAPAPFLAACAQPSQLVARLFEVSARRVGKDMAEEAALLCLLADAAFPKYRAPGPDAAQLRGALLAALASGLDDAKKTLLAPLILSKNAAKNAALWLLAILFRCTPLLPGGGESRTVLASLWPLASHECARVAPVVAHAAMHLLQALLPHLSPSEADSSLSFSGVTWPTSVDSPPGSAALAALASIATLADVALSATSTAAVDARGGGAPTVSKATAARRKGGKHRGSRIVHTGSRALFRSYGGVPSLTVVEPPTGSSPPPSSGGFQFGAIGTSAICQPPPFAFGALNSESHEQTSGASPHPVLGVPSVNWVPINPMSTAVPSHNSGTPGALAAPSHAVAAGEFSETAVGAAPPPMFTFPSSGAGDTISVSSSISALVPPRRLTGLASLGAASAALTASLASVQDWLPAVTAFILDRALQGNNWHADPATAALALRIVGGGADSMRCGARMCPFGDPGAEPPALLSLPPSLRPPGLFASSSSSGVVLFTTSHGVFTAPGVLSNAAHVALRPQAAVPALLSCADCAIQGGGLDWRTVFDAVLPPAIAALDELVHANGGAGPGGAPATEPSAPFVFASLPATSTSGVASSRRSAAALVALARLCVDSPAAALAAMHDAGALTKLLRVAGSCALVPWDDADWKCEEVYAACAQAALGPEGAAVDFSPDEDTGAFWALPPGASEHPKWTVAVSSLLSRLQLCGGEIGVGGHVNLQNGASLQPLPVLPPPAAEKDFGFWQPAVGDGVVPLLDLHLDGTPAAWRSRIWHNMASLSATERARYAISSQKRASATAALTAVAALFCSGVQQPPFESPPLITFDADVTAAMHACLRALSPLRVSATARQLLCGALNLVRASNVERIVASALSGPLDDWQNVHCLGRQLVVAAAAACTHAGDDGSQPPAWAVYVLNSQGAAHALLAAAHSSTGHARRQTLRILATLLRERARLCVRSTNTATAITRPPSLNGMYVAFERALMAMQERNAGQFGCSALHSLADVLVAADELCAALPVKVHATLDGDAFVRAPRVRAIPHDGRTGDMEFRLAPLDETSRIAAAASLLQAPASAALDAATPRFEVTVKSADCGAPLAVGMATAPPDNVAVSHMSAASADALARALADSSELMRVAFFWTSTGAILLFGACMTRKEPGRMPTYSAGDVVGVTLHSWGSAMLGYSLEFALSLNGTLAGRVSATTTGGFPCPLSPFLPSVIFTAAGIDENCLPVHLLDAFPVAKAEGVHLNDGSSTTAKSGTGAVPYAPTLRPDGVDSSTVSSTVSPSVLFHSICAQPAYADKSVEELRWEDSLLHVGSGPASAEPEQATDQPSGVNSSFLGPPASSHAAALSAVAGAGACVLMSLSQRPVQQPSAVADTYTGTTDAPASLALLRVLRAAAKSFLDEQPLPRILRSVARVLICDYDDGATTAALREAVAQYGTCAAATEAEVPGWTVKHDIALAALLDELEETGQLNRSAGVVARALETALRDRSESLALMTQYAPDILAARADAHDGFVALLFAALHLVPLGIDESDNECAIYSGFATTELLLQPLLRLVRRSHHRRLLAREQNRGQGSPHTECCPGIALDRRPGVVRPCLLQQAADQLLTYGGRLFRSERQRWWHVSRFEGENGIDGGGLFRDSISSLADELRVGGTVQKSTAPPLMIPAPNSVAGVGTRCADAVPVPGALGSAQLRLLRFAGRLMAGCAIASQAGGDGDHLAISLTPFTWTVLAAGVPSREILSAFRTVDVQFVDTMQAILDFEGDEASFDALFGDQPASIVRSDGLEVVLTGASSAPLVLRMATRRRFVSLATAARTAESAAAMSALRAGMLDVMPPQLLALWPPAALELAVCGDPEISVEELKLCTECDLVGTKRDAFWGAVELMTHHQRSDMLRFATGRQRLPVTLHVSSLHADGSCLAKAATCSTTLYVPDYRTPQQALEKLLKTFELCLAFDKE